MAKKKKKAAIKLKKAKPAKAKLKLKSKPKAKPKAKAKAKPKLKAKPAARARPAKPAKPAFKIKVDPADHVPGAAFQAKGKIDRLPKIVSRDEDKGLGEGLGYAAPTPTKPAQKMKGDIVPDADDQAPGIAPGYEPTKTSRVAVRRDQPTTHSGSGTLIPDEDDNLGQHEF